MGKFITFKQVTEKEEFIKITGLSEMDYDRLIPHFWEVFSHLFKTRDQNSKHKINDTIEEFISTYLVDSSGKKTFRFADYLRDLGFLSESYSILYDEYYEYSREWIDASDLDTFELISMETLIEFMPVTFNDLARIAKFVSIDGKVLSGKRGAYDRMWNVFQVTFMQNEKHVQVYLEDRNPYDYVKLNGFSPNGSIKSVAKYLQDIDVLDNSYSILNQDLFDFYEAFWEEIRETDRSIYEIIDGEMMKRFKDESADRLEEEVHH